MTVLMTVTSTRSSSFIDDDGIRTFIKSVFAVISGIYI